MVHLQQIKKHIPDDLWSFERGQERTHIGAYCLMPNHMHLLFHEHIEWGISSFMKKLLTAYSMYFNIKYDRTGTLFESRFKAVHVTNDNHLKYLFTYIHLNPISIFQKNWKEGGVKNKREALDFLEDRTYSSYSDYGGFKRKESCILSRDQFPDYFADASMFNREILGWLSSGLRSRSDLDQFESADMKIKVRPRGYK